jgi:hypothetical protein
MEKKRLWHGPSKKFNQQGAQALKSWWSAVSYTLVRRVTSPEGRRRNRAINWWLSESILPDMCVYCQAELEVLSPGQVNHRVGNWWAGLESNGTGIWGLHPGCMCLMPNETENYESTKSESSVFHNHLFPTGWGTTGQSLKVVSLVARVSKSFSAHKKYEERGQFNSSKSHY